MSLFLDPLPRGAVSIAVPYSCDPVLSFCRMASFTVKTEVSSPSRISSSCAVVNARPDQLSSSLHVHLRTLHSLLSKTALSVDNKTITVGRQHVHHLLLDDPHAPHVSHPFIVPISIPTLEALIRTLSRINSLARPYLTRIHRRTDSAPASIAVWERKRFVVIPLGILCLAHWALLWRGMFVLTAEYDAATMACVVTTTRRLFLSVTFWASMYPGSHLWFAWPRSCPSTRPGGGARGLERGFASACLPWMWARC